MTCQIGANPLRTALKTTRCLDWCKINWIHTQNNQIGINSTRSTHKPLERRLFMLIAKSHQAEFSNERHLPTSHHWQPLLISCHCTNDLVPHYQHLVCEKERRERRGIFAGKTEKGWLLEHQFGKCFIKKILVRYFTIFTTVFFTQEKMFFFFWINQGFTTKRPLKNAENIF